jgi:hypothetical protein
MRANRDVESTRPGLRPGADAMKADSNDLAAFLNGSFESAVMTPASPGEARRIGSIASLCLCVSVAVSCA